MLKSILFKIRLFFSNPYKRAKLFQKQGVRMGTNCQVFSNVYFGSEPYLISLGNYVKITYGCKFITHDGGVEVLRNLKLLSNADYFGQIKIGDNVFIGNSCIILPDITIGSNVIIGTGSVVTKDIPDNSIAVGIPAKVIKTIDEYYNNIKDKVDYTKNYCDRDKKEYLIKKYKL